MFYHAPIGWEWGLILGACFVFVLFSEAYKFWVRPHVVESYKRKVHARSHEREMAEMGDKVGLGNGSLDVVVVPAPSQ
jgi:hypothetical protein